MQSRGPIFFVALMAKKPFITEATEDTEGALHAHNTLV